MIKITLPDGVIQEYKDTTTGIEIAENIGPKLLKDSIAIEINDILYDLSYQYGIDCLTAGLVYRREFYQDDDDIEPKDTLMFTISFVPFANVKTPSFKQWKKYSL